MSDITDEERKAIGQRLAEGRKRAAEIRQLQRDWETQGQIQDPVRVLRWRDLPRDARKSARNPRVPEDTPVQKMRCVNCRLEMWTRHPKWEDLCERCEFVLIDAKHRDRGEREKARSGRMVNPFREVTERERVVNPLAGPVKVL